MTDQQIPPAIATAPKKRQFRSLWMVLVILLLTILQFWRERSTLQAPLKSSVEAEKLRLIANQQTAPAAPAIAYLDATPKNAMEAEEKRVIRQSLSEIMQLRRESDSERNRIYETLKKIFTVESIDSSEVGSQLISAVQEQVKLDRRMSIATADWMEQTRLQLEKAELSQQVKNELWRGYNEKPELFRSRESALTIERQWADSTVDFYTFTIKNRDHITINAGNVLLDSDALLADYNSKLTRAKKQWADLQDAVREQMRIQAEIERETGSPVEVLQTWLRKHDEK